MGSSQTSASAATRWVVQNGQYCFYEGSNLVRRQPNPPLNTRVWDGKQWISWNGKCWVVEANAANTMALMPLGGNAAGPPVRWVYENGKYWAWEVKIVKSEEKPPENIMFIDATTFYKWNGGQLITAKVCKR